VSHDPLVVNTQDGSCWLRQAVTRGGKGLYALAGTVSGAPDMVLSTMADLAEHGLASVAFALPMPVGPAPQAPATDGITRRFAPTQALREDEPAEDVSPQVAKLRSLLDGQRAALEDRHDGPLAHTYRVPRDLEYTPNTVAHVVAYRDPHRPQTLLCREHGPRYIGMTPVTAEDLPDGGVCTYGGLSSHACGRDVLADGAELGGAR